MKFLNSYIELAKTITKFFFKKKELLHFHFNFDSINKIIIFFSVFASLFLGLNFFLSKPCLEEFNPALYKIDADVKHSIVKTPCVLDSLSFYLKEIKKRDIFTSLKVVQKKQKAELQEKKEEITNLVKSFSLVGIFYQEGVAQAMIKDKDINKTYFIKEKDKLKQLEVKTISADKVILEHGGEEWELR
ncbi:MAG: hypothetical protein KAS87_04215 [Candidatus Omnitrophica bacterium]|nr:hypothetical protein [Candidatus Omnitrophota bacterium]